MRSLSLTLTSFVLTLATTCTALNMQPLTHPPLLHLHRNNSVSIALWPNYMTLGLSAHPPSHLLPPLPKHPSPVLSGLVRVNGVDHHGLVWVVVIGTRPNTSCSNAPPYHPLTTASLEAVPLMPMSLALLMVAFPLATSNAPPIVSYALCPPDQTLLDW